MLEQSDFRAKHSIQLLRVVGFLSENLNKNTQADAIFLDVANVFDNLWNWLFAQHCLI